MQPKLKKVADDLRADREVPRVTVRDFLWWWGFQRRSYWNVWRIRQDLKSLSLKTVPDFESQYIDAHISFELVPEKPAQTEEQETKAAPDVIVAENAESAQTLAWISQDPSYRISKLATANKPVVSVAPDATLEEAVTVMLLRDFSQLPVMIGDRTVKGVVSWKTVASRLALNAAPTHARDAMEPHHEIQAHRSIFEAIPLVENNQYVLVRSDDNKITGIITATDLSSQFRSLAEPFLLLSEIENLIRGLIGSRFPLGDLKAARDPADGQREISGVSDLTFGEYIRLLEAPERWKRLKLAIDRARFCADLQEVRRIRNDVMHFDPDGVPDEDLLILRNFASFLKQLQTISGAETVAD